MTEQLHHGHEKHETQPQAEHVSKHLEKELAEKAAAAKHEHHEDLENIKLKVEQEAISSAETAAKEDTFSPDKTHQIVLTKEVKKAALKESLSHIRSHLNKTERGFSKILHKQSVDRISEFGGKTLARPSGLLAGGLVTFLGTIVLIYLTRYYGYTYRYGAFLLLFAVGFAVGLFVELLAKLLLRRRRTLE